jgi:hypothetical protein
MISRPIADPVLALRSLGYTEREASFLYMVGVHSGYFLRRQFDYFINRNRGAIAQHFLEKVQSLGHAERLDCGESRFLYHLYSKPIYRMLGNADSQNRRWKSDGQIRARLMTLDYALENDQQHYLASEAEKIDFFSGLRKVPREFFTGASGSLLPALVASAVSLSDRTTPSVSPVRFQFSDEALLTEGKFCRFLTSLDRLLRMLGSFDVVYASTSPHTFSGAEQEFMTRFGAEPEVRQQNLCNAWTRHPDSGTRRHPPLQATFTSLLLTYHYPQIRRKEEPSLGAVRRLGLSPYKQPHSIQRDRSRTGSDAG